MKLSELIDELVEVNACGKDGDPTEADVHGGDNDAALKELCMKLRKQGRYQL